MHANAHTPKSTLRQVLNAGVLQKGREDMGAQLLWTVGANVPCEMGQGHRQRRPVFHHHGSTRCQIEERLREK